jgi:hypothetical protein
MPAPRDALTRAALALALGLTAGAGCGASVNDDGPPGDETGPELQLTTLPFEVPAGTERLICQYFPASGVARWLDTFNVEATPGMHHVDVFRVPDTGSLPTGAFDCTDDPPPHAPMLPPTPRHMTLPPGVAYQIAGDEALFFNTHFINTTSEALHARVRWTAGIVAASDVTAPAGVLFFPNPNIYVPPEAMATITKTCSVPGDFQMFMLAGHFHDHTSSFTASLDGDTLLELTQSTKDRATNFDPPISVGASTSLTWTCVDENTGATPIVYGPSVLTNEMCQASSYVFPVPDSATLRCD